jgi:hypothetical protein
MSLNCELSFLPLVVYSRKKENERSCAQHVMKKGGRERVCVFERERKRESECVFERESEKERVKEIVSDYEALKRV